MVNLLWVSNGHNDRNNFDERVLTLIKTNGVLSILFWQVVLIC